MENEKVENEKTEKEKTTQKTWFVILLLIIFWPIGLILMWANKKFNMPVRVILSIICALSLVGIFGGNNKTNNTPSNSITQKTTQQPATTAKPAADTAPAPTPAPQPAKPDLEILDHHFKAEQYARYVTGTVKNNTSKNYSYVQVEINLYDNDDNQVGSALANTNNLEPGGKWKFKAIIMEDTAKKYKIKDVTGW